jgi:hypothetical protein
MAFLHGAPRGHPSAQEEKIMPAFMRKLPGASRPRIDPRDGDPYLERLLIQLGRLRDGDRRHSMQNRA